MAWTELTRRQHDRVGGKYASDLTDAEWTVIAPLMPPRKMTGRPRTTELRDVFDAILYIATTGCQWEICPKVGDMIHIRSIKTLCKKHLARALEEPNRICAPFEWRYFAYSLRAPISGHCYSTDAFRRKFPCPSP